MISECLPSNYRPDHVNDLIRAVEKSLVTAANIDRPDELMVGVDLGTAYIVLVVVDRNRNPVATEMVFSQALKDGVVVDYMGAMKTVRELKEKLELRLGVELTQAAIAMPSNTAASECKTHRHIVESCGMDVVNMMDEPTAANQVLNIANGAVVDIGGGTTGLSVFKDGQVIYTMDEATGGTHLTLVLAGHFGISFEEAEAFKKETKNHSEVVSIVRPVIEKMASIIKRHTQGYDVRNIFLVGGTTCLPEFESIVEQVTGISSCKPLNPCLVTPLGIAISGLDMLDSRSTA